jgi:hypothetical protein
MGAARYPQVRFVVCPHCGHDKRLVVVDADGVSSTCYVCNDEVRTASIPQPLLASRTMVSP